MLMLPVSGSGFLSTPSARRATHQEIDHFRIHEHFYPRPPRGGRLRLRFVRCYSWAISIHALREEGDEVEQPAMQELKISIHALREEGDEEFSEGNSSKVISIHALREEGVRHRTGPGEL